MKNSVILITRAGFGFTAAEDADFGAEMLDKFLHTLESQPEKPLAICFYTEGVKMVADDSPVLLGLKLLEKLGVRMLACQSCLESIRAAGSRGGRRGGGHGGDCAADGRGG